MPQNQDGFGSAIVRNVVAFTGLAMIFHGVRLIHAPAGWITLGGLLLGLAVWKARE